jgi:uncharacterized protein
LISQAAIWVWQINRQFRSSRSRRPGYPYFRSGARSPRRDIVEQQITVRTPRVDKVAAATQKTIQLLQAGIVLNSSPGQGLIYKFSALNFIKPDMITEATRNAHAAADRFALDSGSKVGSIREAN